MKEMPVLKRYPKNIEITTNMGCSNRCVYCPQSLLLNTYYKDNKNRKSKLTLEDFKLLLTKIPDDFMINFGGMSEPFENDDCVDMILYAYQQGRQIRVNTTLKNIQLEQLKRISHIPFQTFYVHVPDADRLQKQDVTAEYLEKVKFVKTFINVTFMVIGRPDDKINAIMEPKLTSMQIVLRGGNLARDDIPSQVPILVKPMHFIKEKIVCSRICECVAEKPTDINWPVLLPDGTVLICCVDYGMKHQLGNIFYNTLDEIMAGKPMQKIKESMMKKNDDFLICRSCEWAMQYDKKKWKNFVKKGTYSLPPRLIDRFFSIKKYSVSERENRLIITFLGIRMKFRYS